MSGEANMQQNTKNPILIVGICSSLSSSSYTRVAVQLALQGAQEVGAQTQLIDLRDYDLVFCTGNESDYPEDVSRLRSEVRRAQGIILGTPEYHGSLSGVLKNCLDLMGFAEFEGKMLGLVGVSGGSLGAVNALNSLRSIGRALHAWVLPEQASISDAWRQFDQDGKPKDKELEERIKKVGRDVARFAYLLTSEQSQEFLRAWESAPINPGGAIGGGG